MMLDDGNRDVVVVFGVDGYDDDSHAIKMIFRIQTASLQARSH